MTSKPNPGYTERHDGTVFATWAKSRWTWDFKTNQPLAFWVNREAHYANYCYLRRMKRIASHRRKRIRTYPVTSHSINNECLSLE